MERVVFSVAHRAAVVVVISVPPQSLSLSVFFLCFDAFWAFIIAHVVRSGIEYNIHHQCRFITLLMHVYTYSAFALPYRDKIFFSFVSPLIG